MKDSLTVFSEILQGAYARGGLVLGETWELGRWLERLRGKSTARETAIRAGLELPMVRKMESGHGTLETAITLAGAHGYELMVVLVKKENSGGQDAA